MTDSDTEPVNNPPDNNNQNNNNQNNNNQNNNNPNDDNEEINNFNLNETIVEEDLTIKNQQGTTPSGAQVTQSTMDTTDPQLDPQIKVDLEQVIETIYDDVSTNPNKDLINEIRTYAQQIECEDFQGKGTIDDYSKLFEAASKIANETKQMNLDIDIQGFNEFGQAADELSALFNSFIVRLQNVSIINDTNFLNSILDALKKIVNLSNTFGKFKETIFATSSIHIPKSINDTKIILEEVSSELNCAMKYIGYFVDSTQVKPNNADLSVEEKNVIDKAVSTIDNWNILCEHGVSIALTDSSDIQYIKDVNSDLKNKTNILKNATNALKAKFAAYNVPR
jgi:hypothetical protein